MSGELKAKWAWWKVASALTALAVMLAVGGWLNWHRSSGHAATNAEAARADALKQYSAIPLYFERNVGQTDPGVRYLSRTPRYTWYLTDNATVVSVVGGTIHKGPRLSKSAKQPDKLVKSNVRIRLVGANPHPEFEALEPLPGRVNYLTGSDPSKFHRGIPTYGRVEMKNVYPGVDLVYYGTAKSLEYDLVAAPGADTSKVKFAVDGAATTTVDKAGNLVIKMAAGAIVMQKPRVYQKDASNQETPVEGSFSLAKDGTIDAGIPSREVGFKLASYDRSRTLVIDPTAVVLYSSYLGGSASSTGPLNLEQFSDITGGNLQLTVADAGVDVSLDGNSNAYITGVAYSMDFPTTLGAFQTTLNGDNTPPGQNPNVFVAEFNYLTPASASASLIYSTYIGGTGDQNSDDAGDGNGDLAFGIAADSVGDAFVVGQTYSMDFPLTATTCGAFGQTNTIGGSDANVGFVTEVAAGGASLTYSCYITGASTTEARVALSPIGCGTGNNCAAYVAGSSQSDSTTTPAFPVSGGAFQSTNNADGLSQATFLVVAAGGQSLTYATLYGGSGNDSNAEAGLGVALDGSGHGYITGATFSSDLVVPNGAETAYQGGTNATPNAFLAEFDPTMSGSGSLLYGTYLGGTGAINAEFEIAVGDAGTAIAFDTTTSTVWVTGFTASTDFAPAPTANAIQTSNQANVNAGAPATAAFLTQLDTTQSGSASVLYSSYFSGTGFAVTIEDEPVGGFGDAPTGIALSGGNVFLTGVTTSGSVTGGFPLSNACPGSFSTNMSSGFDFAGIATVPITSFISEINPTVSSDQLIYSTLLGGTGMADATGGIQVDPSGNIVVGGLTFSTDFPVTSNAFQSVNNAAAQDQSNAFLTALNPTVAANPTNCPTMAATATPTATPTTVAPGGDATIVQPGATSGQPGATVNLGTFTYTPSDSNDQSISEVDVSVSNPGLFSALILTPTIDGEAGDSVEVDAPDIETTTAFVFDPSVDTTSGLPVTFELSGVLSGGATGMTDLRKNIRLAGVVGGSSKGTNGFGSLWFALSMLGFAIVPLSGPRRRRVAMIAAILVVFGTGLLGCGGSSGGTPFFPNSNQQVVAIDVTEGETIVPVSGLPVNLGTIKKL